MPPVQSAGLPRFVRRTNLIFWISLLAAAMAFAGKVFLSVKHPASVGGDATALIQAGQFLFLWTWGEFWVQVPFEERVDGSRTMVFAASRPNGWRVLLDGEPVSDGSVLQANSRNEIIVLKAVDIGRGSHSWILRSRAAGFLRVTLPRAGTSFAGGTVHSNQRWRQLNTGARILPVGRMFTGDYVNVNIARDAALLSRAGKQYISYYDPEGHLVVARRDLGSTCFEKYWLPVASPAGRVVLDNPHLFISMQMDEEGYLHLAWGQHSSTLNYARSQRPHDPRSWVFPRDAFGKEFRSAPITYVSFIRIPGRALLAMFRVGVSGHGDQALVRYDPGSRQWITIHQPLIQGMPDSSPYFWRPAVSPGGRLCLLWTWRLSLQDQMDRVNPPGSFSGFSNTDICAAFSDDLGQTWKRSNGAPYSLPIRRTGPAESRADVVVPLPMGEDFFNHYGADVDALGRYHFAYTRSPGGMKGVPQQWHLVWDGCEWITRPATDYGYRFRWTLPQMHGRASTYLTRPSIVVSRNGRPFILSRSHELGDRVECLTPDTVGQTPWIRQILFDGVTGGWEPQMDLDLWHAKERLNLLLCPVKDPWNSGFDPIFQDNMGYVLEADLGIMLPEQLRGKEAP